MKIQLLLLFIFFISGSVFSQPRMELSEKAFDFGVFRETEGKQSHTFLVTNRGNQPLVIQNVVPSCGCTISEWTKAPIPPDGKGKITAIFDPSNRGGRFSKTLTVYTNSAQTVVALILEGEVIAREKSVEETYTWPVGSVRFESSEIFFSGLVKTEKKIRVMPLLNASKEPVKIEFADIPVHLEMKTIPSTLKPGQKGLVECTYYGAKDERWGNVRDMVRVKVNGVIQQTGFYVSANLNEDFSTLSKEELSDAPVFKLVSPRYDIGPMEQSAEKNVELSINNDGGRDLIIRDIRSSCECIEVMQGAGSSIKPGGSGIIRMKFSSEKSTGSVTKSVYIYSNDPRNSQAIILIHADIKPGSQQKNK